MHRGSFVFHQLRNHHRLNAPKIFALITDLERHAEWSGSGEVGNVRKITEGPVAIGTRFEADENLTQPAALKIKFVAQSQVTAFEQDHLFRWTSRMPKFPEGYAEWTYELTPDGDKTKVTESVYVYFCLRWFDLLVGWPYRKYRSPYMVAGMDGPSNASRHVPRRPS